MTIPLVDLTLQHQSLSEEISKAMEEVFNSQQFVLGPFVKAFEEAYAGYLGVPHCVGLNSGTDALLIALKCLNIGPGDEVITVANSFFATVEAILHVGARPRFVDVSPETGLMDIEKIKSALTKKTRAILPVHLYGQPVCMDPLLELARGQGLFVIEDACQAHGALTRGKKVGTLGDVGCFSFYPGKNLGALGDGGALVTNHSEIAMKARKMGNHGGIEKYQHDMIGYNSRLDGLQANILLKKLKYLDTWNEQRRGHALLYQNLLKGMKEVECLSGLNRDGQNVFHLFVIKVPPQKRPKVQAALKKEGIATGIHYPTPLHHLLAKFDPALNQVKLPVTESLADSILSLPMYPELTEAQIQKVVYALKGVLE